MGRVAIGLLALWTLGCGAASATDAGAGDASPRDAGSTDASVRDADASDGRVDAAVPDFDACVGGALDGLDGETIAPPDRDSDAYVAPTAAERGATRAMVEAALAGDAIGTRSGAMTADYDVCASGDLLRLTPRTPGAGRALFVLRVNGARPLVVAAPHAWHETNTLPEALAVFERLSARALVITGSHRCASLERSTCDGTTSVCDGSALPFRRSDAAHNVDTDFQAAHEALFASAPGDLFVNVHGMSAAGLRISDGTQDATASTSTLTRFAAALVAAYPAEPVEACSAGAGVPVATRLCGTTNVQGRLVNASVDACGVRATSASGRFLHVEQSRAIRDDFDGVIGALDAIVPASP